MQLNVQRIDERIHKLQEIRRIVADPEMLNLLMEFISTEEERREPRPAADGAGANAKPHYEDKADLAKVLDQVDEQPRSGGLWGRTRA
jgi:hypothetical protein